MHICTHINIKIHIILRHKKIIYLFPVTLSNLKNVCFCELKKNADFFKHRKIWLYYEFNVIYSIHICNQILLKLSCSTIFYLIIDIMNNNQYFRRKQISVNVMVKSVSKTRRVCRVTGNRNILMVRPEVQ